ncbi:MAG: hypothetical protein M0C28_18810 [Candidatus Moduliflexus flocculans]|nr:hypothetical protein [Candidatus Moduliflexus flocculans]
MELPEYRHANGEKHLHAHLGTRQGIRREGRDDPARGLHRHLVSVSYFGTVDGTFRLLSNDEIEFSLMGAIGKTLLPLFRPIGFTDWRATVAILTGFVAKESVVGTLGILYGIAGDAVADGALLYPAIRAAFTPLQAYAFMAFALLVGALHRRARRDEEGTRSVEVVLVHARLRDDTRVSRRAGDLPDRLPGKRGNLHRAVLHRRRPHRRRDDPRRDSPQGNVRILLRMHGRRQMRSSQENVKNGAALVSARRPLYNECIPTGKR